MESLRLSFTSVTPIFILMLLGYCLKLLKLTDKKGFDTMNKAVFKVFLPVLLFYNVYKTNIENIFDAKLICFTFAGVIVTFTIGYFAVFMLTKDNAKRGVMLQGFFRSNLAILGLPLVEYVCGEGSGGLTSMMIAITVPLFNILSVVALERFRKAQSRLNIWHILKGVITNPLIIGCTIGLLFFALDIKLPSVLEKSVKDVSSIATPLALIVLGSEFEFRAVKGSIGELLITVCTRLVIVPLVMLLVAIRLGFIGEALACIIITFGSPVSVSSFAMAQQMDGDEQLAAQLVVVSSALCIATLFVWIFISSYMGLI